LSYQQQALLCRPLGLAPERQKGEKTKQSKIKAYRDGGAKTRKWEIQRGKTGRDSRI